MTDRLIMRGHVHMRIYERGRLIEIWSGPNLVTDAGLVELAMHMTNAGAPPPPAIGFGDGLTPAAGTDTALAGGRYWRPVDGEGPQAIAGQPMIRFTWSLPAGLVTTGTISEIGLATDIMPGGVLMARRVRTTPIPMSPAIRLDGTWDLTFARA